MFLYLLLFVIVYSKLFTPLRLLLQLFSSSPLLSPFPLSLKSNLLFSLFKVLILCAHCTHVNTECLKFNQILPIIHS